MIDAKTESLATDTMSRSLQALADQMTSVSASMVDLAESSDCSLARLGLELLGEAQICREWADNISSIDVHYDLPSEFFCRCRDKACPQHESCLRWLARNQGSGDTGFVSESTLRTGRSGMDEPCQCFIEPLRGHQ